MSDELHCQKPLLPHINSIDGQVLGPSEEAPGLGWFNAFNFIDMNGRLSEFQALLSVIDRELPQVASSVGQFARLTELEAACRAPRRVASEIDGEARGLLVNKGAILSPNQELSLRVDVQQAVVEVVPHVRRRESLRSLKDFHSPLHHPRSWARQHKVGGMLHLRVGVSPALLDEIVAFAGPS